MATVCEITEYLFEKAPLALKMDFDNVGLLAGRLEAEARRALLALDVTEPVIAEAEARSAQLIVAHHPLFFKGPQSVTDADPTGKKLVRLLRADIAAVCMHTNLDAAPGGVNDALAAALGAEATGILNVQDGVSRTAALPEDMALPAFLAHVKKALGANGLRYVDAGRPVRRLGLCGGAGGDDLALAAEAGCDTYVTADVKHHQFLLARELGLNLVDAGHFSTENVVVPVMARWLAEGFPELEVLVSRSHCQPERFYV